MHLECIIASQIEYQLEGFMNYFYTLQPDGTHTFKHGKGCVSFHLRPSPEGYILAVETPYEKFTLKQDCGARELINGVWKYDGSRGKFEFKVPTIDHTGYVHICSRSICIKDEDDKTTMIPGESGYFDVINEPFTEVLTTSSQAASAAQPEGVAPTQQAHGLLDSLSTAISGGFAFISGNPMVSNAVSSNATHDLEGCHTEAEQPSGATLQTGGLINGAAAVLGEIGSIIREIW